MIMLVVIATPESGGTERSAACLTVGLLNEGIPFTWS